jgi:hypothetical protein
VAAPQRAVAPGFALLGSAAGAALARGRKGPPAGGAMDPRTDAGADKAGKRKDFGGDADPAAGVGGIKRRKGDGDDAGAAQGGAPGKKEKGKGKGTTAPAATPAAPRAADFGKTEWRVTGGMVGLGAWGAILKKGSDAVGPPRSSTVRLALHARLLEHPAWPPLAPLWLRPLQPPTPPTARSPAGRILASGRG